MVIKPAGGRGIVTQLVTQWAADVELVYQDDDEMVGRLATLPEHIPLIPPHRRRAYNAKFWRLEGGRAEPGVERIGFQSVEDTVDRLNDRRHARVCLQRIQCSICFGAPVQPILLWLTTTGR